MPSHQTFYLIEETASCPIGLNHSGEVFESGNPFEFYSQNQIFFQIYKVPIDHVIRIVRIPAGVSVQRSSCGEFHMADEVFIGGPMVLSQASTFRTLFDSMASDKSKIIWLCQHCLIMWATELNNLEVLKFFHRRGFLIEEELVSRMLILAVNNNNLDMLKYLLKSYSHHIRLEDIMFLPLDSRLNFSNGSMVRYIFSYMCKLNLHFAYHAILYGSVKTGSIELVECVEEGLKGTKHELKEEDYYDLLRRSARVSKDNIGMFRHLMTRVKILPDGVASDILKSCEEYSQESILKLVTFLITDSKKIDE